GRMVATIVSRAGAPADCLSAVLDHAWASHARRNLWSVVPPGLGEALDAARAHGVRVAIVSNSEGMLDRLFADLGIASHFDLVVDSGKVGVEKPDPRIFHIALERFEV